MADDTIWYALLHTRGPAVPEGAAVADQPGIREHYAFRPWRVLLRGNP